MFEHLLYTRHYELYIYCLIKFSLLSNVDIFNPNFIDRETEALKAK